MVYLWNKHEEQADLGKIWTFWSLHLLSGMSFNANTSEEMKSASYYSFPADPKTAKTPGSSCFQNMSMFPHLKEKTPTKPNPQKFSFKKLFSRRLCQTCPGNTQHWCTSGTYSKSSVFISTHKAQIEHQSVPSSPFLISVTDVTQQVKLPHASISTPATWNWPELLKLYTLNFWENKKCE